MYEFYPYFTNDGSVGLYSPDVDDIYHSTYGALSEAYEKFIMPADFENYFKKNNEIKILDICFGIGYNTKSFINNFIKNIYNDTIDTNNIIYSDKIHTNNAKYKISIHAIDLDKNLALMSPFFITDKKLLLNQIDFNNEGINKLLSKRTTPTYKFEKETNIIFLHMLKNYLNDDILSILLSKKYSKYFCKGIIDYYRFLCLDRYKLTPLSCINTFLHNIYYRYVSKCHKRALNCLKNVDFIFKLSIEDARQAIQNDNNIYNYIFLDAFTPTKCPCLWSVDFFKLLYKHLDDNGMILTYSNSALVRNAFLNAGFFIGKNIINGKSQGTIATKNKSLIKNELSEFDLGLIKTKAGIFYRDQYLNASNSDIEVSRKLDVKNSLLISASKYLKENKEKLYAKL